MADNKRDLSSCPYCRCWFSKVPRHIRSAHPEITANVLAVDTETERRRQLKQAQTSTLFTQLQDKFGFRTAIDVALHLVSIYHPVYIRLSVKRVRYIDKPELDSWKSDGLTSLPGTTGTTRASEPTDAPGNEPCLTRSMRSRRQQHLLPELQAVGPGTVTDTDDYTDAKTVHSKSRPRSPIQKPPMTSKNGEEVIRRSKRHRTAPVPRVRSNSPMPSTSSEITIPPQTQHRINLVDSDSDSDDESLQDSSDTSDTESMNEGAENKISRLCSRHGLDVTWKDRNFAIKNVAIVRKLKQYYESLKSNENPSEGQIKHIMNSLTIACKVMKFCSPGKSLRTFQWQHLTAVNVRRLTDVLRKDMKFSPNTIANFFKVIRHMYIAWTKGINNKVGYNAFRLLHKPLGEEINRLSQYNAKLVDRQRRKPENQDRYIRVLDTAKNDIKELLEISKTRKLDKYQQFRVNGYFNLHNHTCGNRPVIYANMTTQAYRHARQQPISDPARHGLTTYKLVYSPKFSIRYTEEQMTMLDEYFTHVRDPLPAFKHILFINSNRKNIYNASSDLHKFVQLYEKVTYLRNTTLIKVMTSVIYELRHYCM